MLSGVTNLGAEVFGLKFAEQTDQLLFFENVSRWIGNNVRASAYKGGQLFFKVIFANANAPPKASGFPAQAKQ